MKEFKIGDKVIINTTYIPRFEGTIVDITDKGLYVCDSEVGGKLTLPATALSRKDNC